VFVDCDKGLGGVCGDEVMHKTGSESEGTAEIGEGKPVEEKEEMEEERGGGRGEPLEGMGGSADRVRVEEFLRRGRGGCGSVLKAITQRKKPNCQ
jgi:hypothetical protein